MVETGDTQTAMLELDQEMLNDRRRRRMLDHQARISTYLEIALREPPRGGPSGRRRSSAVPPPYRRGVVVPISRYVKYAAWWSEHAGRRRRSLSISCRARASPSGYRPSQPMTFPELPPPPARQALRIAGRVGLV